MGSHFLDDFVREMEAEGGVREIVCEIGEPWFNPYGDCIQFLTVDAAYIGDRIDEYLTIFRHHDDGRAIGFMVKGVHALLNLLPVDGLRVDARVAGDQLQSVRLSWLLLTAYHRGPLDDSRLKGYAEAMRSPGESDEVLIPAGCE